MTQTMKNQIMRRKKNTAKIIQTLPKKAPKTPDEKPVAKQPPELVETEPEDPGDSYLEINLRHIAFDSTETSVSVEGTYGGNEHVNVGTCYSCDLTKIMASSKLDKRIK